jgi:hypothetical protein
MADVTFTNTAANMATPPTGTIVRADDTTEGGHTGVIQHFRPDLKLDGTNGFSISVTLTVTNGAYTLAVVAGGLITFAGASTGAGRRAIINTLTLAGVVAVPYELWFFASDIATPAADNSAFTLVAADVAMCKGVIPIAVGDYFAPVSAFNVASLRGIGFEYNCTATYLYAYLKATAVTSPGTTTLTLTIHGEFID